MGKIDFSKRILVSITGENEKEALEKLEEVKALGMEEVCLFLEFFNREQREIIYKALLNSKIESIPLVHIIDDMTGDELEFLKKKYKSKYFTMHEINFEQDDISKWKKFQNDLYLEMNFDNFVSEKVKVEEIGGFCVDLSHFRVGLEKQNNDYKYVFDRRNIKRYFGCNHLNGWDPEKNLDMHIINSLDNFGYLKTLPEFVFGKIIAIEVFHSIKEQLEFKKYLVGLLSKKINL